MKERHATKVTLLLSYLLLVTRGNDAGTTDQWENSSESLIDRQVNKAIIVRKIINLISYIYNYLSCVAS
jgi:hypothetical protein